MTPVFEDLQIVPAVGLTIALSAVGLISHLNTDASGDLKGAVDGSLQSVYEAEFDAANPLRDMAVAAFGAARWAMFHEGTQDVIVGRDGWLFSAEEFTMDAAFGVRLARSVAHVAEVKEVLAEQGIDLLVVAVPDKAEVYVEKQRKPRPQQVARRQGAFVAQLTSNGVDVVDASFALTAGKTLNDTFQRDDTHWSPHGSRAVAAAVARHLEGQVDLTPAQVSTSYIGKVLHDGDLLAFVDIGALRPLIGPAQSTRARFETTVTSTGTLFDATPVDVALVGTSFSAKSEWHFADFLQDALQAELINYAEEGQGPFAPMAAMLASDTFTTTPPKLVIWEIPVRYTTLDLKS